MQLKGKHYTSFHENHNYMQSHFLLNINIIKTFLLTISQPRLYWTGYLKVFYVWCQLLSTVIFSSRIKFLTLVMTEVPLPRRRCRTRQIASSSSYGHVCQAMVVLRIFFFLNKRNLTKKKKSSQFDLIQLPWKLEFINWMEDLRSTKVLTVELMKIL